MISLRNPKASDGEPPKDFFFDSVFGPLVEQKHIYDVCAASVVESVLNGYNGTIFAYGQTGSGKVLQGHFHAFPSSAFFTYPIVLIFSIDAYYGRPS